MIQPKRLSLCMIVKDEANNIERCLKSVAGVVDEMIIVDTGSTDQTPEICRSLGAQVYDFKWNGSFADARNYGIERATGDWILWLDADEEVDWADRGQLRDVLSQENYDIVAIHLVNYYGKSVKPDQVFNVAHHRLFRNRCGFKFVNNIHETLNLDQVLTTAELQKRIGLVPVKVYHYGYLDAFVKEKGKFKRNLNMLEKELERKDYSPWVHYHLASEYYRNEEFEKSFEHVNKSIVQFVLKGYTPPALLYKLKYSILISLGSFDGAWPSIEKAILLYPDYVDLHFYKGIILYGKKMYRQAIRTFDHCIQMGEDQLDYLTLKGLGSFQAMYYKGICYEKLDRTQEAICSYIDAIISSHHFSLAIEALTKVSEKKNLHLETYLASHYDTKIIQEILTHIQSAKKKHRNQDGAIETKRVLKSI
ncbi:glycosyltransferase [Hazenella coriacea]|uniref:glycosyltransferase n=1 Tax=Hazenella coriacea TaxID=1179467 RepID=UPI0010458B1C|nr:glycosyltransferase [Hazenella coriacea]